MGFLVFLVFAVGLGWLMVRAASGLRASSAPAILGDAFEKPLPAAALAAAERFSRPSATSQPDTASGEPGWGHGWELDLSQQHAGAIDLR